MLLKANRGPESQDLDPVPSAPDPISVRFGPLRERFPVRNVPKMGAERQLTMSNGAHGKKLVHVETLFSALSPHHRTREVFDALCEAARVRKETAEKRFRLSLALLGAK
jgi:hypothetical protein